MTKYSKKKKKKQVRTSQKASQKKPKTQNIVVLVYNINYWDKDGSKIIENIKKFYSKHKDYKYSDGQSGSYGFIRHFTIPSNKIKQFKLDIKKFYKGLGIKKLKVKFSINKNNINSQLNLLNKEPK